MARGPLGVTRAGRLAQVKPPGPGTIDFALRSVRGGKRRVMEELAPRAIDFEPRLERAVVRWAQLTPWQRRFVTLDDLAAHAGLPPGEFLGAIARASFEYTNSLADLIVATALPEIVLASVKRALTPDGIEDRCRLLEHMGFLGGADPAGPTSNARTDGATDDRRSPGDPPPAALAQSRPHPSS